MADKLQLGSFNFEIDDLPETIPLGGEQMLAVNKFPGGYKDVQSFGSFDDNISFSGLFNYKNALSKAQKLYQMYKSGGVYTFKFGSNNPLSVIIKNFKYDYQAPSRIPYSIELEIVNMFNFKPSSTNSVPPNTSVVFPNGISKTNNTSAPQRTYIVKKDDSLWKISLKYYGSGSLYKKIASANNLSGTKIITGQKLVIP
jgi:LysM repeat protein